jgi:histidine ammonia-lyase
VTGCRTSGGFWRSKSTALPIIAQIAAVSLIAEDNVLAYPASVTNLPTSANKQDHVSMGMTSALKLAQVVKNVEIILAIELMCAAQGLEYLNRSGLVPNWPARTHG